MVDVAESKVDCLGVRCPEIPENAFNSGESEYSDAEAQIRKCEGLGRGCVYITSEVAVDVVAGGHDA